jgi:hypothetical protein
MKTASELLEISIWRRVLLGVVNVCVFVVALFLAPWVARSIAGEGASWWIGFLILLVPLVAMDCLLQLVLLRPVRRSHAEPIAVAGRPPE